MRSIAVVCCVGFGLGLIGCVDQPNTKGKLVTEPQFYASNVKGYAETAAGLPPEIVYGWNVNVAGEEARWRECSAIDACGGVERTRPKAELLGIEKVGNAEVDGQKVDVIKLSLSPRPGYVVPNFKPTR